MPAPYPASSSYEETALFSCTCCRLPSVLCICRCFTKIETRHKFHFLIARSELNKRTNTGLITSRMVTPSEVTIIGEQNKPVNYESLLCADRENVLVFPGGQPVSELPENRYNFILPDSSWRQARKMGRRVKENLGIQQVSLKPQKQSQFVISRGRPEHNALCTMEAVIEILTCLKEKEGAERLAALFGDLMVAMKRRSLGLY